MTIAALVVSIAAIIVSTVSVIYARVSAKAAQGMHEIEHARWLEERKPRLSGAVTGRGKERTLRLTSLSREPLTKLVIRLSPSHGVRFAERAYKSDGLYEQSVHDILPGDSATWIVEVASRHSEPFRFDVDCWAADGASWNLSVEATSDWVLPLDTSR